MKVQWDFQEFIDFKNNFRGIQKVEMLKRITHDISEALLECIKKNTPRGKTGRLIQGWNDNKLLVREVNNGYEVLLVNETPYASHVNDGHQAYNQFGGPYEIKRRIKVTSPHQWQKGDATFYVFGHFFVERGIVQLKNTQEIEQIIMKELQKWWDSL